MAESSRLSPESSLEAAPRPTSFLQSALGLFRTASRPSREAGPTIRVMFAPTRAGRQAQDESAAEVHDDPKAMRRALKVELNRVSGSRYVLRHLAKIEHDLKVHGLETFDRLPLRVLEKASAQLESLVESPITPGVAALRSRLAVAMLARERVERPGRAAAVPGASAADRRAGVPEAATPQRPAGPHPGEAAEHEPVAARAPRVHRTTERDRGSSAAALSALSAWGGEDHLEVRESSFADFEQASTEWQLLDEPRKP
ncbi:MAG: hypothetical protein MUC74_13365 [Ideonella sp.]|jgi:hypothetical protein|nr:hypothetical protein [Ideonella sp.]